MKTLQERFDEKWMPEPNSGCHLWMATANPNGYGMLWGGRSPEWAHRVSFQLAYGEIPAGLRVLHRCDTPACVNPAHLFAGTQADNVADMMKKGRHKCASLPGSRNPRARLDESGVVKIRALRCAGWSQREIARELDVSQPVVWAVLAGKRWTHV